HLTIIVIGFAVFVLVMAVDGVERALEMVLVDVRAGDHLTVGLAQEIPGVARALHAPSHHTHGDAFGRRWPALGPESARRNNRRCGNCCTGQGQEMTSRKSCFSTRGFHWKSTLPQAAWSF